MKHRPYARILAALCVLALLAAVVPAVHAGSVPVLKIDSATGTQGGSVSMYVTVSNAEALRIMEFTVGYDPQILTLSNCRTYTGTSGSYMDLITCNTQTPGTISVSAMDAAGVTKGYFLLLRLTFQISETAPDGSYPFSCVVGNVYAGEDALELIAINTQLGAVTVARGAAPTARFSLSGPGSVAAGETAEFTVSASNAAGMVMGQYALTYDSDLFDYEGLTLLSGLDRTNVEYTVNANNPGLVLVAWMAEDPALTGEHLRLSLKAKNPGETTVACSFSSLFDGAENAILAERTETAVTVLTTEAVPELPALYLEGPDSLFTHETATLTLMLDGSSRLAAVDYQIAYDPAVLEILSVEAGEGEGMMFSVNGQFQNGLIRGNMLCGSGITADTALVHVTLRAKSHADAETALTLQVTEPVDKNLQPVALELRDKPLTLTVQPPAVTEADGQLTVTAYGLEIGGIVAVSAYEDGQHLQTRLYLWEGTPLTVEAPTAETVTVYFLTEEFIPVFTKTDPLS